MGLKTELELDTPEKRSVFFLDPDGVLVEMFCGDAGLNTGANSAAEMTPYSL